MAEQSFAELLKEEEESTKPIRTGEIVTGQVIEVSKDEIILSIAGNKSEGVITRDEYSNDNNVDLTTKVQVGDEMEAKVIKLNDGVGMVSLSYKRMAADRGNRRLEEAFENQEVLTAKVTQVLDGGLSVEVEGVRVFIPASLVSDSYEKDLSKYAGQDIEFVITEFNPKRRRIIGDRKALLVARKAAMKEELFARIQPGDVTEGVVKNVTDFGAFVELEPGVDALLHVSQISREHVEKPSDVLKIGQEIEARVVDFNEADHKISLSIKALMASGQERMEDPDVADVDIDSYQ